MDYFSSDFHLGHKNILKYAERPFDCIEDMDRTIIDNVNRLLKPGDTLWFLGDFCMGNLDKVKSFFKRFHTHYTINFISGNHDKEIVRNYKDLIYLGCFSSFYNSYVEVNIEGVKLTLCHYSMEIFNKAHHGAFHLFGHSHNGLAENPGRRSFDCGVDCSDPSVGWERFTPISWEQVKRKMARKAWVPIDHHDSGVKKWPGKPVIPDQLRDPQGYAEYKVFEKNRTEP